MANEKLKHDRVYTISIPLGFYKKFGFNIIMAGQMETRWEE